jgi:hypothetical protein
MVMTPVGARCPTCANVRRFNVAAGLGPAVLLRAVLAGIGVSLAGNAVAGLIPFLGILGPMIVGYLTGRVVSDLVKRRRSQAFASLAAGCFVIGFLLSPLVTLLVQGAPLTPAVLPLIVMARLGSILGLIAVGVGALLAWMQAR